MNNLIIGLKRFFTNKNVVTIILVLIILVALYWGYSSSIKSQTNPVSVPVAKTTIGPQTQITSEHIEYKQVANSMLDDNVIRSTATIIGKYTNINVTIPKGSPFYKDWLETPENIAGNWIEQLDYENGELPYYMNVNMETTLGNSILPNSYIDIYMKAQDENGTVMFGKLIKNIKVLVVHDSAGKNVFADNSNIKTPSRIGFGVTPEVYTLLRNTKYLNLDLVIVPRGVRVPSENYAIVTSSTLRDYVDARTITIDEDTNAIVDETELIDENNTQDLENVVE